MQKIYLALLVCGSAIVVGCGKSESTQVPATPAPKPAVAIAVGDVNTAPEAVPAPDGAPAAAPVEVDAAALVDVKEDPNILTKAQALDLVVNDYISQYGKAPSSLEELVARKMLPRLPQAPAGKKFILDKDNHVIVANQ